ncbi:hypothetical protein Busp01_16860 [Trinickia caryophylli]|nr:hypothetical protein Busp01_16860 [Trinickia caryophylli]
MVNLGQVGAQAAAARAGGGRTVNLGVSPAQALQGSQRSIQNLGQAARAIAAQVAAQQAAAALATANVPNGLAPGGLEVAPGASSDPNNPALWINANLPAQTRNADGTVKVDVKQTAQSAVLTWQTMNVGRQTTLNFDQSAGTQANGANNWVVLNRIQDPSGKPSQILGNITAQGSVYVVNRNGILFGPGSQVNLHSLVASSLDFLNQNDRPIQTTADVVNSNKLFLGLSGSAGGLASLEQGQSGGTAANLPPNEVLGLGNKVTIASPGDYQTPGAVTIAPGASITTHANGTASDGGFVLIAAPSVNNGGSIVANDGQVVLAAGVGVALRPNPTTPQVLLPELSGALYLGGTDVTPVGVLTNSGLVSAARGNINLLGTNIYQNGVVAATTSVNTPGRITISTVDEYVANTPAGTAYPGVPLVQTGASGTADATSRAGELVFGSGSVTAVLPDGNGQTATSTPGTTFAAGAVTMTAGAVWLQSGSLIEAPGSTVTVAALTPSAALNRTPSEMTLVPGRVYLDDGAAIDVSGIANYTLPMSSILLAINTLNQNDLADSPLQRTGLLNGLKGVIVDSTQTGTRGDGVQWVGSPLLNLAGAVNLMPRTVDQLLTNGGTINLSGQEVLTAPGSVLNLNGGYVHYLGGTVATTRLIDASGAIVPIGQADPNDRFVAVAGTFVDKHPRWNVTNQWHDPLLAGGVYQPDFIVGGNAGTLNVFASKATVLDGTITAESFAGARQVQGGSAPAGGTFALGVGAALTEGAATATSGASGYVILQDRAPQLGGIAPGFNVVTALDPSAFAGLSSTDPDNVLATTVVPVRTLNEGGFSKLAVTEDKRRGKGLEVAAGTQLALQPGGSVNIDALGPATILGNIAVPAGTIAIQAAGDLVLGANATLNVAGQWVNNDQMSAPASEAGGKQFINGGSITLATRDGSLNGIDTTGSIILQPGSVIDLSSGGEMLANGQLAMANGVPLGTAGSLSLLTYQGPHFNSEDSAPPLPTSQPSAGRIAMAGLIKSYGFAGGGTLTLQAPGFQIGGDAATAPAWDLVLPESFFSTQGFGKYVLNAMYDTTVAPGANVVLTQRNLLPDVRALQQTVSGSDIAAGGLTSVGTLDAYRRQPTSLVLTAGGEMQWLNVPQYAGTTGAVTVGEGAAIVADAGASIGLGSPLQVTVLGKLVAPGGSITLSADSGPSDYSQPGQYASGGLVTTAGKSVWLGADAVLDARGVALIDPLGAPAKNGLRSDVPTTGRVLPGGSVTISDDSGFIVAQAGSVIDVSGAAATLDRLQPSGGYASQTVWSDAGSITLSGTSGLLFDGTLRARPGAPEAQGGTLTLLAQVGSNNGIAPGSGGTTTRLPGATAILFRQSGDDVPADLAPGQSLGTPSGVLQFAADRLTDSGISTLVVRGSKNPTLFSLAPVAFAGDVTLTLPGAAIFQTGALIALQAGAVSLPDLASGTASIGAPHVTIDAPYVEIQGQGGQGKTLAPIGALADATLDVNASFIDIVDKAQLANFGQANFTSTGDIRLSSVTQISAGGDALEPGELFSPGNMTFKAASLYPSTGSTFILDAVGPAADKPTTIAFASNGSAGAPLSAGGTLLVDANRIVQAGTVRAPSGALVFGVGDPSDAATKSQFNNLPLVATDSVLLANGSVTSVSNGGLTIPYGATVDGTDWRFDPIGTGVLPRNMTAPPAKYVGVNAGAVSLDAGATIDLSGGGNLQAAEWVPGLGGTRDVLSQYTISYASSSAGVAVPVNAGGANVFAVMPGVQSPVAAYDPSLTKTAQPATGGYTTSSIGVGQAGLDSPVGQSVYLSGVPGLPAGFYTLLPAKYATLPGAYRVTLANASGAVQPGASQTLPDGTIVTAGYFGNALTGSRSATPVYFDVQAVPVWQQYSDYTVTGANAFFSSLAANAGHVAPQLPKDAGQLVLAAQNALTLGAKLQTGADSDGAPAEVDIASRDIQIVGDGQAALPGYLAIGATELGALNAGSLLIGGTRTQTTSGITINALANSVVVSNDAAHPLQGPEIILVTKTDTSGSDPNAANGLRIDAGSVVTAKGDYPAVKDVPISIGQVANSTTGAAAVSGDGALLEVSNGAPSVVTRANTTGTGQLTIQAGAILNGGQSLTLDSSGSVFSDPAATFAANVITVDGSSITFANDTHAVLPSGFIVGAGQLAQFANAQQVNLRSSGAMNFIGDIDAAFTHGVDLSAASFTGDGGAVTISGRRVALTNEVGTAAPAASGGGGSLTVNADEIDLGTGNRSTNGFGAVTMNANGGMVGQGNGVFDFGGATVTFNAPVFIADQGSGQTVRTTGALALNAGAGTPLAMKPVGGALTFIGGTLDDGALIEAPAGNVTLEATSGNLTIHDGARVSTSGVAKQFYDVTQYAPGGAISLKADAGTVDVRPGATLDFAGAGSGAAAGSLALSAPKGTVQLAGTIKGQAAGDYQGGSLSVDTGGAVDLDSLAIELAASGVDDALSVWTRSGNLTLSSGNRLKAARVSLTADGGAGGQDATGGNVRIDGTIDASGTAGGQIALYGKSGVDVEGSLIASAIDGSQRGGSVNIGTTATPRGTVTVNGSYGYENISAAESGVIRLGPNALIDVSGGRADPTLAGSVNLRAPLLSSGDVNVELGAASGAPGPRIRGAGAVKLEAYAIWSTTDPSTGAQHFDGIVDPAGWYDGNGNQLAGTTTNGYFTPTVANTAHQNFYGYINNDMTAAQPGTLMSFIENGLGATPAFAGRMSGFANFEAVPGVALVNPDASINNGGISVLTNWNLGAGLPNNSGTITPAFRYQGSIAPRLTLQAAGDITLNASITDGFYQSQAATILGASGGASASYDDAKVLFDQYVNADTAQTVVSFRGGGSASLPSLDPANYALSAPLQGQSGDYYANYVAYATAWNNDYQRWQTNNRAGKLIFPISPSVKVAPLLSNYATYALYAADYYAKYMSTYSPGNAVATWGTPTPLSLPTLATDYATYISTYVSRYFGRVSQLSASGALAGTLNFFYAPAAPLPMAGGNIGILPGNAPASVPTVNNPLPLAFATLSGGQSSSYRIVAGSDTQSANPLALQAAWAAQSSAGVPPSGSGNVTLNGHTSYVDSNGATLLEPTMIRTGTGSIDIAARNDLQLTDSTAPGVVYTAGAPAAGSPAGRSAAIAKGDSVFGRPDLLVTTQVNPDSAGDITIHAQHDIRGVESVQDTDGSITGQPGANLSQFWWPWMEVGPVPTVTFNGGTPVLADISRTSINFGAFGQGVMSVGGDVSITAGRNISDLGVSLPTTWYKDASGNVVTVGGGNLVVKAGGDVLSGDYFVAKGTGSITAGGRIGADFTVPGTPSAVGTLLAAQDTQWNVVARQGVDIGGVFNPSYVQSDALLNTYHQHADGQGYSPDSAVNVFAATGDVTFGSLPNLDFMGGTFTATLPGSSANAAWVLPAGLGLVAFSGGIDVSSGGLLYPSATGNLNLIGDGTINVFASADSRGKVFDQFGLADIDPSAMPSPTSQTLGFDEADYASTAAHTSSSEPAHVYSLTGSVVDGAAGADGLYRRLAVLRVDKPSVVQAGDDIVNLVFRGQNGADGDITRIVAGRDIYDAPFAGGDRVPSIVLGGPGTLEVEAGRNLGPFTNQQESFGVNPTNYSNGQLVYTGINTVGNAINPNLQHESADIDVLFGVAPGIDTSRFIASYIDPAGSGAGIAGTPQALVDFMRRYGNAASGGPLTPSEAWARFETLPSLVQRVLVEKVFFDVLTAVGQDYNRGDASSNPYYHQYARGYQAINTLFPASLGYTANSLGGGSNGTAASVVTGNLDMRGSTIQTQQGGNISILGPGGRAMVGGSSSPPAIVSDGKVVAGPGTMGILTLEKGDINIFTDSSLLLAQSRVFTEQGGNMTIWSSNGDINAGKGASTAADIPPPNYLCDANHYCALDARGEVTGAGIATLQTIPGAPPGEVNLLAPRGTVDAGAAGVRASGNLNIAALHVANAVNIQAQGTATGATTTQTADAGALTSAGAAASAAGKMAQDLVKQNASGGATRRWVVTVEVDGFGQAAANQHACAGQQGCAAERS